jgi:hypothetical protein
MNYEIVIHLAQLGMNLEFEDCDLLMIESGIMDGDEYCGFNGEDLGNKISGVDENP